MKPWMKFVAVAAGSAVAGFFVRAWSGPTVNYLVCTDLEGCRVEARFQSLESCKLYMRVASGTCAEESSTITSCRRSAPDPGTRTYCD